MTTQKFEIRSCDSKTTTDLLWIGGTCGEGLANRDCFELVKNGTTAWKAAFEWELLCGSFQSQLVWEEAHVALFGSHDEVYALDIDTGAVTLHQALRSYFGSFRISPMHHLLLVLTGQDILAFNEQLKQLWSTQGLAVDGVVCQEISETLTVDCEMDPPGDWQRVTIDLKTGAELTRELKPH
jgi:hypothetical protein